MWLWCAGALGQTAPGSTEVWWSDAGPDADDVESAVNTSISGDGTTLWVAMEWLADASAEAPALWLWRAEPPYTTLASTILQPAGALVGTGIYPSIVTWPGAAQVWVTSKQDELSSTGESHAHLYVWRQNRDDLTLPPAVGPVTEPDDLYDHGRVDLAYDDQTDEHYLCFTGSEPGDEDLVSFVKNANAWSHSYYEPLSADAVVEDHCTQAFTGDGTRVAAFHKNDPAGGEEVWLDVARWDGAASLPGQRFTLQGSSGHDFPSVWVSEARPARPSDRIYVAAKSGANDLSFWSCSAAAAPCDSAAAFGTAGVLTADGDNWDPKVFSVPTADELSDHVFVLYQKQIVPRRVGLLVDCGGTGTFVDAGLLPMPAGYARFGHQELGGERSSASPSVYWDGATLHIPFLARSDDSDYHRNGSGAKDDRVQLDLLVYHGDPDDFCP